MNYLKITKYIYLAVGFVMLFAAIMKLSNKGEPWLEFIIAGTAFFTYFFRNRFDKKFEKNKSQSNQNNP